MVKFASAAQYFLVFSAVPLTWSYEIQGAVAMFFVVPVLKRFYQDKLLDMHLAIDQSFALR
jgi:mannose/fructose/N-acetylgalactosamine-specific phosphotransferase system component IID